MSRSMFQCSEPSDALMRALDTGLSTGTLVKKHIRPQKTTPGGLFRLFTSEISPEEMARQKEAAAEGTKPVEEFGRKPKPPDKARSSYAERYYWALLEADRAREELKKTGVQEAEAEGLGVKPLEGKYEIELEVTVNKAPDASDSEEESEEEKIEEEVEEEEESEQESVFDAAAELAALQTELAKMDEGDEEIRKKAQAKEAERRRRAEEAAKRAAEARRIAEEQAKKALREKQKAASSVPTFQDVPHAEKDLARGGTMFFAPDAERLALAPSLPPPPPPSEFGRHLIKMKPRLPLDISWGRYRDEQVLIPELESITEEEMNRRVQEKLRTVDFWAASRVAAMKVQQEKESRMKKQIKLGLERTRAPSKHWENQVGKHVTEELKKSRSWMNWRDQEAEREANSPTNAHMAFY